MPDHTLAQTRFHRHQFLCFALEQTSHGNAGPLAHQLGDVLFADFLFENAAVLLQVFEVLLRGGQFPLDRTELSVADFRDTREISGAFQALFFGLELFDLLLQLADLGDRIFFDLPSRLASVRFLAESGQFDFELFQALFRVRIRFMQQRLPLDFQVQDAPLDFINFDRKRIHLHAQARGGFVDQVDGLVRKEPVGDVAV